MPKPGLSLCALAACAAFAQAARADRPPLQLDLDRCVRRAVEHGSRALSGQVRFDLLKRADGQVYAAYVRGETGMDDRFLENCLANVMVLWRFGPEQTIDYVTAYPLSLTPIGNTGPLGQVNTAVIGDPQSVPEIHMPASNYQATPLELNVKAAQATLQILEDATLAERGMAHLSVHDYAAARARFQEALARAPGDPMALRGMAIVLAETKGDLGEARKLAEQAIAAQPRSEAGHEALLRVCLAARDDRCAFEQWKAANAGADVAPRAYELRGLEAATRLAAARLQASAGKPAAGAARGGGEAGAAPGTANAPGAAEPADPCAQEQGEERQALCVVKRCLDAGSAEYATELSRQNAVDYVAGDWRTKVVSAGKLLVTRPIAPKDRSAGAAHDALWLVKMGDNLVIQPSNTEARQITLTHNACGARAAPR